MFYHNQTNDGLFIWNDHTKGNYGPFKGIYSKNELFGESQDEIDILQYPGYKYSIGWTEKRIFILGNKSLESIHIRK